MTRTDVIHYVGWWLVRLTYWLDCHTPRMPFMCWNELAHQWLERNHACCTRHGYHKDGPPRR